MGEQTLCPVCEKVLVAEIFPEFLYCEVCSVGVKRIEQRKSIGQARAVFDLAWANKHHKDLSSELTARSIMERVKRLDGVQDILDIGCGSGLLVDLLSREGYDSTGLDFSADTISFARLHKRGGYLCASVAEVKRKYDLVIMSHILEHIPDPIKYLWQVAHLLNPAGLLLVVIPNLDSYDADSLWRRESHITLFDHTHNTAFSRKGLSLLLEKAGYSVLGVSSETLGASILNRVASGLFRHLRGSPTIYKRQEPNGMITPDRLHRLYKTIAESKLVKRLCYIINRMSERGCRGLDLVILATVSSGGINAD